MKTSIRLGPLCQTFRFYRSKAGIASPDNTEQLIIALEPEGGAIFCRERKLRDFVDQTGDASVSDVLVRPGLRYVMMDIGGTYFHSEKIMHFSRQCRYIKKCLDIIKKLKTMFHYGTRHATKTARK